MKKNKVLVSIFIPGFNFNNPNSAVAIYLHTLADALLKNHFEVDLFPSPSSCTAFTTSGPPGKLHFFKKKLKNFVKKNFRFLYFSLVNFNYFRGQKAIFDAADFDKDYEVFIEFLTLGSSYSSALKKRYKKPFILIYDSPLPEQFVEMHGTETIQVRDICNAEKTSLENADLIICYSNAVKKHIENAAKVKARIEIMPCIVWKDDLIRNVDETSAQVIGFIGSFLSWHKVEVLVKAFEKIALSYPSVVLKLIGYGEEWDTIKMLKEASPFSERIIMTGFVTEQELAMHKSTFTIAVMPGSNWYGSPLKLFEYAQAGIPLIAPETPTVLDLFQSGKEALFIDKNRPVESLTELMDELLKNSTKRKMLSEAASLKMNTIFAKDNQMNNFIALVQETINNGIKE
jgi:glycosyltransferase involved in cell wall biosynthesis